MSYVFKITGAAVNRALLKVAMTCASIFLGPRVLVYCNVTARQVMLGRRRWVSTLIWEDINCLKATVIVYQYHRCDLQRRVGFEPVSSVAGATTV